MAVSKRKNKKIITNILSIACMVVAVVGVFGYALPAYNNAKNLGISVGDRTGTIVGNVIGSFDGITTGLAKGAEDGKEEGLSAKDTKSEIKNNFSEIGNLEVLEAGVKLKDVNTLGDDYAALFLLKGVAIYSVNLKDVEINDIDANAVEILLPPINVEIYIDESATEKLAEYQKPFVKEYDNGGMSSGVLSGKFWVEKGIPLLVERYHKRLKEIGLGVYSGHWVRIVDENDKVFEGFISDYFYADDNESGNESIVLENAHKNLVEFEEKDIKKITVIKK